MVDHHRPKQGRGSGRVGSQPGGQSDSRSTIKTPTAHEPSSLTQPNPIRGQVSASSDMPGPFRTRSTPPTTAPAHSDGPMQPRFTPHKSNGPPIMSSLPVFVTPPGNMHHRQFQQMYGMYAGQYAPEMYQSSLYHHQPPGRGYPPNYIQQPNRMAQPQPRPVKRASKALQIVDPATGKPIVVESSTDKSSHTSVNGGSNQDTQSVAASSQTVSANLTSSRPNESINHCPVVSANLMPTSQPSATLVSPSQVNAALVLSSSKQNMSHNSNMSSRSSSSHRPGTSSSECSQHKQAGSTDDLSEKSESSISPNHANECDMPSHLDMSVVVCPKKSIDSLEPTSIAPTNSSKSNNSDLISGTPGSPEMEGRPQSEMGNICSNLKPDFDSTLECRETSHPVPPESRPTNAALSCTTASEQEKTSDSISQEPGEKYASSCDHSRSQSQQSTEGINTDTLISQTVQNLEDVSSDHEVIEMEPSESIHKMIPDIVQTVARAYTLFEMITFSRHCDGALPSGISLDSHCLKHSGNANVNGFSQSFNNSRGFQNAESRRPNRASAGFRNAFGSDSSSRRSFRPDDKHDRGTSDKFGDSNNQGKYDKVHYSKKSSTRGGGFARQDQNERASNLNYVEPLKKSATRWTPKQQAGTDEDVLKRKIKSVLNKLTLDKFDVLSSQFLSLVKERVSTMAHLKLVVKLIFDKALSEPTFVKMYSSLCVSISEDMPEFNDEENEPTHENKKAQTFKRLLLNQCQQEFERGTAFNIDPTEDEESREESLKHQKRRFLGNVRFIGELFKDSMLAERIMHTCIYHFLQEANEPVEEDIEALCKLLATIGKKFDRLQAKNHIDSYFARMHNMSKNTALSARARFMLLDTMDLRSSDWQPRRKEVEAKTIDKFREAMEREAQEKLIRSNTRGGRFDSYSSRMATRVVPRLARQANSDRSNCSTSRGAPDVHESRRTLMTEVRPSNHDGDVLQPLKAQRAIPKLCCDRPVAAVTSSTSHASYSSKTKQYPDQVESVIKDYLNNPGGLPEIREVLLSMDWDLGAKNKATVFKALNIGLEHKDADRDNIVTLLAYLNSENVISSNDVMAGFYDMIEFLTDVMCDVPHAPECLGSIYGNLISEGLLSIDSLARVAFVDQINSGSIGRFVCNVLQTVEAAQGSSAASKIVGDSLFDLHIFLRQPFRDDPSDFVKNQGLCSILPQFKLVEEMRNFLKDDLVMSDLHEWIGNALGENPKHATASIIARTLLEHCVLPSFANFECDATCASSKDVIASEKRLIEEFAPLFIHILPYLRHPDSLLSEVHKFCFALRFPPGLSLRLFKILLDLRILPPQAFETWRKEDRIWLDKSRILETVSEFLDQVSCQ